VKRLLYGLILLGLACPTPTGPQDLKGLIPADNEVTGWTRSGGLDSAKTSTELTALLDSLAQPYIDNGFRGFCRQRFFGTLAGRSTTLELRVADMGDTTHARSVFAALAATGQTPWTGDNPGAAARIRQDSVTCAVDFHSGGFYVWLSVDTGSIAALNVARFTALKVAHKADSTAPEPAEPKDCVNLVPSDNEISGWAKTGSMQLAETPAQLEAIINGEAVPYVNNHFVKAVFQNYSGDVGGSQVELDLRIVDLGDTTNAKNLYAEIATGTEVPWTGDNPGVEARTDESFLFSYRVEFRDERFYYRADIMDKSTAAQDIAKLFARNVSAAIRDTTD
jgi:hypothetical protein